MSDLGPGFYGLDASGRLLCIQNAIPTLTGDQVLTLPNGASYFVAGRLDFFATQADAIAGLVPTAKLYGEAVNAERDRRVALGVTITVSPGKAVPVDTRGEQDLLNIGGLAQVAKARVDAGDTTPIQFRGSDNVTYSLTPAEMWTLANGAGVAAHVQLLYAKAWALKDAFPAMAADITADANWQ
jgi:Domain of unknown function (DUF4376)